MDQANPLTLQMFQESVMAIVGPIPDPESDLQRVLDGLVRLHREGWSIADAVAFCRCLEEVRPNLPEATALERMERLKSKYAAKV